ncbi:MAG TPA: carbohydrate kinase family protein [Sphaerochaeta sp.]|nr:carbohydrate kinase family protein [Sphaerochaeta sp.]
MQRKKPILTIGPIFCDMLLQGYERMPLKGEELYLQDYIISLGGNAIIASALSQLNIPSGLLATVGDDLMGEYLIRLMKNKGILQDHIIRLQSMKTNISCIFTQDGERSFLTWVQQMEAYQKELKQHLFSMMAKDFSHIHVSFELLNLPYVQDFLVDARASGVTTSTDLGFQDAQSWSEQRFSTLSFVDYFFPNIDEAKLITGLTELPQILEKLSHWIEEPIITLGEQGVSALSKEHGILFVPAPSVEVCNTTGSGDSFVAGFLYGRYHGMNLYEALQVGVVTGSLTASSPESVSSEISEEFLGRGGLLHA